MTDAATLADQVAKYPWYHTLDLGDGVVTRGMFDHRPVAGRYLLPDRLDGLRCLDVATMDGFWAFEMERRGASETVALDIDDPEALDWPLSLRHRVVKTVDQTKGERFGLARSALGSRVERVLGSVYDASPEGLGRFDLVFCGDLLVHLKDPITALERIRALCRGSAIISTPIIQLRWPRLRRRPLAELDGIENFSWWTLTEPALERMTVAAGFAAVERGRAVDVPVVGSAAWRGRRGIVRGDT
jgi:tRNA (mo5U34)-methyltransferase